MKYVCVLSTDNYLDGVLVLNENLKKVKSKYDLVCLVNNKISKETRDILSYFGIKYKITEPVDFNCGEGYWKYTFDKINIFSLTEYKKIVYLDCDMYIKQNIDSLFDIDCFTMASDYPCSGGPNSAIMIIKPNEVDYNLLKLKVKKADLDFYNGYGDQNVISEYFKNINILDYSYNEMRYITQESMYYYDINDGCYAERNLVYLRNKALDESKIVHYTLEMKPWMTDKPFADEYYYEYNKLLSYIKKKKIDYYLSTKKLLIITYIKEINEKVSKSLQSLKNQDFRNINILICTSDNKINQLIKDINLKNTKCVKEIEYNTVYDEYDYVSFFNPDTILKSTCYKECLEHMLTYNLDCIQFNCVESNDSLYFSFLKLTDDIIIDDRITSKSYDKIFKTENTKGKNGLEECLKSLSNIGIIGKAYYDYI